MSFTEDNYEKAVTALFEQMGYTHLYGPDIERDYYVPFYCIFRRIPVQHFR